MDNVLTIDRDDLVALAHELAELRRETVPNALSHALRAAVERERTQQAARDRREQESRKILARIHALLPDPRPSSDHSWLYDENGLPI